MNGFKRTLVILLGIAVTLLAGELTLRAVSDLLPEPSPWPSAATEVKAGQLGGAEKFDVVFLGSSVTEAAVDPELLLPLNAYNAALPFSSPISNEKWLTGMFPDLGGTVVVLGVPAWPFHEEDNDVLSAQIVEALTGRVSAWSHLDLYGRSGLLADWFSLRARELTVDSGAWTEKGHQTAFYGRSGDSLVGRFPPYGAPAMSSDAEEAIRRIAERTALQGGQLVLMIEPGNYPGRVTTRDVDQYIATLNQLADRMMVPIWNSYDVDWSPDLYADEAHFNRDGTRQFSAYVASLLAGDIGSSS